MACDPPSSLSHSVPSCSAAPAPHGETQHFHSNKTTQSQKATHTKQPKTRHQLHPNHNTRDLTCTCCCRCMFSSSTPNVIEGTAVAAACTTTTQARREKHRERKAREIIDEYCGGRTWAEDMRRPRRLAEEGRDCDWAELFILREASSCCRGD